MDRLWYCTLHPVDQNVSSKRGIIWTIKFKADFTDIKRHVSSGRRTTARFLFDYISKKRKNDRVHANVTFRWDAKGRGKKRVGIIAFAERIISTRWIKGEKFPRGVPVASRQGMKKGRQEFPSEVAGMQRWKETKIPECSPECVNVKFLSCHERKLLFHLSSLREKERERERERKREEKGGR